MHCAYLADFLGQDVISTFACVLIQVLIFLLVYRTYNINTTCRHQWLPAQKFPMNTKNVDIVISCFFLENVTVLNFQ